MLFALLFLAGMTFAAEITIPSGDSIQSYIDAAADGDVLILEDGGVYYDGTLTIAKSLTIKAVDGYSVRPIIHSWATNGVAYGETATGAEVVFKGIEFVSDSASYLHRIETGDSVAYLEMTDIVAHGYDRCLIRASNAGTYIDSVLIDNCHFYDFSGGDYRLFYIDDDGRLKYFKAVNSTFENFDRTFLQLKSADKKTVILDHCNIHRRIDSRDDDMLEVRGEAGSSLRISNCIITDIRAEKIWDISDDFTDTIMNVFYWDINNEANMIGNTWSHEAAFTGTDPMFTDTAVGDLTLKEGSPALTASTSGGPIGDPRWAPAQTDDATLKALSTDVGTLVPAFSSGVYNYTLQVASGTNTVIVYATTNSDKATIVENATVDVSSGSGTYTALVTAEDGTTQLTYTIAITVSATGIGLNEADNVKLYYNAGSDQLRVLNAGDVEMLEIYSLTGKLVASERVGMQESFEINTGKLQSGLYLVRMKLSGNQVETGKFVK